MRKDCKRVANGLWKALAIMRFSSAFCCLLHGHPAGNSSLRGIVTQGVEGRGAGENRGFQPEAGWVLQSAETGENRSLVDQSITRT